MRIEQGKTYKEIFLAFGVPYSTVKSILKRFRSSDNPLPFTKKHTRPNRKVSDRCIGLIGDIQRQSKSFSLAQIKRELDRRNINVSKSTIHKYRHSLGFKKRKLYTVPILTDLHIEKRLAWCTLMRNHNWKRLAFTDESVFEMNYHNQSIWYDDQTDFEEMQRGYHQKNEKVMIAGIFTWRGKSNLQIWKITNLRPSEDERVNNVVYKQFLENVQPDVSNLYPGEYVELVLDNAKAHLASAKKFLMEESPVLLGNYQPPNSPDTQPSELIWAWMKKRVYSQFYENFDQLINLVRNAWDEIPLVLIQKCITHCKNRCRTVTDDGGRWPLN